MNKISGILFLIALLSICAFPQEKSKDDKSQEKPNFSGTWVIDKEKSYSSSEERKNVSHYTLVIAHSGEQIKIFRNYIIKNNKSSYTDILYTDKRKERNVDSTGMTMQGDIESKTSWKKQTIVRHFIYDTSQMPAYTISDEKYSLSKDGKILTITIEYSLILSYSTSSQDAVRQNGYSLPKRQLVFNKQE